MRQTEVKEDLVGTMMPLSRKRASIVRVYEKLDGNALTAGIALLLTKFRLPNTEKVVLRLLEKVIIVPFEQNAHFCDKMKAETNHWLCEVPSEELVLSSHSRLLSLTSIKKRGVMSSDSWIR